MTNVFLLKPAFLETFQAKSLEKKGRSGSKNIYARFKKVPNLKKFGEAAFRGCFTELFCYG
ncbi:hypothetical protein [Lacticaseibacillus rhamnosus]|jgi:hypothetical protein|uniref:hypothetical protein n=1 Tax=Lacticaseibacillus rhamnosus TaxID=47715 RepID=UPI0004E0F321|nr:hypothetical protein [Lacticaseibacillus rhamnosus]OFQ44938.1 hypothetical protein HMPREF2934_12395 [Lactobacillus sp. HMSC073B09]KFK45807.1 hypothetical protein LR24_10800 [Lacticaseibacillus rhamnosus]MDM7524460.1 hypothetical protein [Lacticaseibacillus rhamnosus]OAU37398.1 hypothetical protein PY90_04460 [Lacticaseibacillus rhamnosus]OAU44073.1 hypothetical protein PY86_12850 [Lacticaseibacillus rhamnosus]